jgi:hypothetical protein
MPVSEPPTARCRRLLGDVAPRADGDAQGGGHAASLMPSPTMATGLPFASSRITPLSATPAAGSSSMPTPRSAAAAVVAGEQDGFQTMRCSSAMAVWSRV